MSKIPDHAQKVFTGVVHDVYQWEQVLFDGSTATFECLKRPNTIVVLPIVGHDMYYAEQTQPGRPPFLSLFGGRAEPNEEPLDTAQRELKEETGLISNDWSLYHVYSTPGKIEWDIYYFIARDCIPNGEQQLDAGEQIVIKKTSIESFINNVVTDPNFSEYELQRTILSGFNEDAANTFINKLTTPSS